MKQEHLSENELQQFALKQQKADPGLAAHVHSCANCAAAIANYRAMFSALSTMEKPVFNFDIEKQVMAALPVSTTRKTGFSWSVPGICIISVVLPAISVFIMRSAFINLFRSIPALVLYLVIATALTIIILQCRELLAAYRKKMNLLNYY